MAIDLTTIEDSILSYLRTNYAQFEFLHGAVPEDEELPRDSDGEVPPLFLVRFGNIRRAGRAIAGPRFDEYTTWVELTCVSSYQRYSREALNIVTDGLTGFAPTGGSPMFPDGGQEDFAVRSYATRPVMFVQSQRFRYQVNTAPSRTLLKPPEPPEPTEPPTP